MNKRSADAAFDTEDGLGPARIFLPRAKQLAQKLSVPWPESFEAATLRHLNKELTGIQR